MEPSEPLTYLMGGQIDVAGLRLEQGRMVRG